MKLVTQSYNCNSMDVTLEEDTPLQVRTQPGSHVGFALRDPEQKTQSQRACIFDFRTVS